MKARLAYAIAALASVIVGSIVVGGSMLALSVLLYHRLTEAGSPGLAVTSLVLSSCLATALVIGAGYLALRRSLEQSRTRNTTAATPDQMIASELVRLIGGQPTKLVVASLGVGFVLGLSPRLRRAVYRSFVD